ncbi:copper resistance D family protein [Pseudoalteromonas sp. SCQQ13]|uniref:copper resistance D family protein n=1 Tax=Pseudoalteromonas sp. SCQQ13 TaxID=2792066 RepID=UPI0018CE9AA1|nr:CopD family protein [Pseudoalteromonas sp. SCQQ13]MBH0091327.1 CopD family protein [Pseudoalteromonas sp. SCQQ13]
MQLSDWSVLLLLLKIVSYLAIAALAGCLLMRLLNNESTTPDTQLSCFNRYLKRWQITLVMVGFIGAILQIPIEAGAMAESGFAGMIDPFMLDIIWQSVIGEQVSMRVPAFIIALFAVCTWRPHSNSANVANFVITLFALIILTYSFTLTGHSAEKSLLIKSILTLHLIAIASWIGSLWPLYKSCQLLSLNTIKHLMERFGQLAIIIIAVLLISGITLLWQYLNSFSVLFTSNYGQLIMLKLLLVSAMLLLGAWHKLRLVPQITQQHHVVTLKRSISVEMLIAVCVLLTTSVFTTLVGPPV